MPFFKSSHSEKVSHTEELTRMAEKLSAILRSAKRITRPFKITKWVKVFKQMVDHDKLEISHIQSVLAWYEREWQRPFSPKVWSAESFRTKYPQLREAAERSNPLLFRGKVAKVSPVVLSICEELKKLVWPKAALEQLSNFVYCCRENLLQFQKDLQKFKQVCGSELTSVEKNFLDYVCTQLLDIEYIVTSHTRAVHKKIVNWKQWDGILFRHELKPGTLEFSVYGRDWGEKYNNNPYLWDALFVKFSDCKEQWESP